VSTGRKKTTDLLFKTVQLVNAKKTDKQVVDAGLVSGAL
jgi:hypothetical protein